MTIDLLTRNGVGVHFDGVASRLTCSLLWQTAAGSAQIRNTI